MPEEVHLLVKKGIGKLVEDPGLDSMDDEEAEEEAKQYQEYLEKSFQEQKIVSQAL